MIERRVYTVSAKEKMLNFILKLFNWFPLKTWRRSRINDYNERKAKQSKLSFIYFQLNSDNRSFIISNNFSEMK